VKLPKLYWVLGPVLIFVYALAEFRGVVFSGTDGPSGGYVVTSSGQRAPRGVGFFFFGTGYRGGK